MIHGLIGLLSLGSAVAGGGCDFVVDFGSYGAGPDSKRIVDLQNYLKANDALLAFEVGHRGKEGEAQFCVHVKKHMDLLAVKGHLERIVSQGPATGSIPRGTVASCRVADLKTAPAICKSKFKR